MSGLSRSGWACGVTASGKIRQPGYGGVAIARVCRVGSAAIAASASSNLVLWRALRPQLTLVDTGNKGLPRSQWLRTTTAEIEAWRLSVASAADPGQGPPQRRLLAGRATNTMISASTRQGLCPPGHGPLRWQPTPWPQQPMTPLAIRTGRRRISRRCTAWMMEVATELAIAAVLLRPW